jgi:predicted HicB family RNase H-like nuclease
LTFLTVAAGPHNSYTHLQREEVGQIKAKEASGAKRLNVNIPTELHNRFKSAAAAQGLEMTVVILQFIESYVAKNATPQKKGRRA